MNVPSWAWTLGAVLSVVSVVLLVVSAVAVPRVVAALPADTLVSTARGERNRSWWLRNGLGALLFVSGVLMLVLPGQGLLCMVAGLLWMDVPGKQALAVRALQRESISSLVNGMRTRRGAIPFEMPSQ